MTSGADVVLNGDEAIYNLTSGANQVSIGYQAGKALTTALTATFIGYDWFNTYWWKQHRDTLI